MNVTHTTDSDGNPMTVSSHECSEPPYLGHTWDLADPAAPIYLDADRPRISEARSAAAWWTSGAPGRAAAGAGRRRPSPRARPCRR